ncbi:MAG: hypothetical protein KJ070_11705 [Verrucomicrobia bacterium]|nr:hypothetical protein [Verrucomicrobiota bacterium]
MTKNRKHQTAAVRFGPALKAFLLCALIGGAGVGYVWQKSQIEQLARQIKTRELRLAELQFQNDKARVHLGRLRSPLVLEQRIRDLHLGLAKPLETQIWRLPEPAPTLEPDPVTPTFQSTLRSTATEDGSARPPAPVTPTFQSARTGEYSTERAPRTGISLAHGAGVPFEKTRITAWMKRSFTPAPPPTHDTLAAYDRPRP